MSQRRKKKLESLKIRNNKYTQRANEKKRAELSKTTTTNKRGRQVDKKKGLSNLPKEGQRALVLKQGGHGMGSDYKSSEKKAFKKAEKWQKSDEKKKITENYKKGNKNTGGGNGGGSNNNKLKVRKGKSSIEQENRDRFGDAHVDKLKQKQVDFKKMKKKQMTKAEFIKKYPKSITAQKAKGLRR